MLRNLTLLLSAILLTACSTDRKEFPHSNPQLPLTAGSWRMTLDLGDEELPLNLTVRNEAGLKVDVINSEEVLTIYEFIESGDSLRLKLPLFDSEFLGVVSEDKRTYSGVWKNYGRDGDYQIPFHAEFGKSYRFCETNSTIPPMKMPLRYKVDFSPESEADHYPAIGLFEKTPNSNRIVGTFATETGDYRFLEGNFCDGKLKLSCFDGSHAFLFSADYENGELTNGIFHSGKHWTEPWSGTPDKDFELRNPDELTTIVDSSALDRTSFYDKAGNRISLGDMNLEDKVTIIQILGTWCPNCMDETISYKYFYEKFHSRGLEIIPIAFEGTEDPEEGRRILEEYQRDLGIPYPLYYGGKRGKTVASEAFPSLNHVISYPTSIFIGRDGKVKKVHTGFYGPGTGLYYDNWLHDTEKLLDSLLTQS